MSHPSRVSDLAGLSWARLPDSRNVNQTEQDTWEQSWIQGVPPGHDLVTNPTCPQPAFTRPRLQFVTLNRLRCGQARCAESLYRWGVITSPACLCGESHQTTWPRTLYLVQGFDISFTFIRQTAPHVCRMADFLKIQLKCDFVLSLVIFVFIRMRAHNVHEHTRT